MGTAVNVGAGVIAVGRGATAAAGEVGLTAGDGVAFEGVPPAVEGLGCATALDAAPFCPEPCCPQAADSEAASRSVNVTGLFMPMSSGDCRVAPSVIPNAAEITFIFAPLRLRFGFVRANLRAPRGEVPPSRMSNVFGIFFLRYFLSSRSESHTR